MPVGGVGVGVGVGVEDPAAADRAIGVLIECPDADYWIDRHDFGNTTVLFVPTPPRPSRSPPHSLHAARPASNCAGDMGSFPVVDQVAVTADAIFDDVPGLNLHR